MSASSLTSNRDASDLLEQSNNERGGPSADDHNVFPRRIVLTLSNLASQVYSSPTRHPDSAIDVSIELEEGTHGALSGNIGHTSRETQCTRNCTSEEQDQDIRRWQITASISQSQSHESTAEPEDKNVRFWQRRRFLATFTVYTTALTLLLGILFFYLSYRISLWGYDTAIQANELAALANNLTLLESCRSHLNNTFLQALEVCRLALLRGDSDSISIDGFTAIYGYQRRRHYLFITQQWWIDDSLELSLVSKTVFITLSNFALLFTASRRSLSGMQNMRFLSRTSATTFLMFVFIFSMQAIAIIGDTDLHNITLILLATAMVIVILFSSLGQLSTRPDDIYFIRSTFLALWIVFGTTGRKILAYALWNFGVDLICHFSVSSKLENLIAKINPELKSEEEAPTKRAQGKGTNVTILGLDCLFWILFCSPFS